MAAQVAMAAGPAPAKVHAPTRNSGLPGLGATAIVRLPRGRAAAGQRPGSGTGYGRHG